MVLLFLLYIPLLASSGERQILYVKANASSPCPMSDYRIVACQTLNWYGANANRLLVSNALMLFQEGNHQLNTSIEVYNCHNFTMAGNGSTLRKSNGQPKPTTTINCTGATSGGMLFTNSSNVSIHNLEFKSCSAVFTLDNKYTYAGSLGFHLVRDISLGHIVIVNAKGFGLHTVSIHGAKNVITDSVFSFTSKHPNSSIRNSGNAGFNFGQDVYTVLTVLKIQSSWFLQGESKRLSGGINVYIRRPNVIVKIVNVTAQGNIGENGGNLALFLFLYSVNSSMIIIDNSCISDGKAKKGGGLRVWTSNGSTNNSSRVFIRNTLFRNNSCWSAGGALYIAYYSEDTYEFSGIERQVTIQNCTFTLNHGDGAAMEIIQHISANSSNYHHFTHWFETSIESCTFEGNSIPFDEGGPILDFISVEVSIKDCTFIGSNTTAISLRNTYVNLFGDILFENNKARVGGALKICDASLIFAHNGTRVRFVNNSAQEGGAIYVQQPCMDTWPLCPIQPAMPKNIPVVEFAKLMKFEFTNNSATIAGDAVYGGSLDRCTTIVPYELNTTNPQIYHYYWYSKEIFAEIFDTQEQQGSSWITSDPFGVCFCQESQEYNMTSCITNLKAEKAYYPGEEISVTMITIGQMNGSTLGMIQATLLEEDPYQHSLTQTSLPQMSANCINLTYILNSNKRSAQINFKTSNNRDVFSVHHLYGQLNG